eukprot:gene10961-22898_t
MSISNGTVSELFDDGSVIIRVLSNVLTRLIDVNLKSHTGQHFVTKFQSSYAPGITVIAYLERIRKYARCSDSCFIVALIYIDRIIEIRNVVLTALNVHRILITSVLVAAKFFDDEFYNNAFYAKLGGVPAWEMNSLELEFLHLVNFSLYVKADCFSKYHRELLNYRNFIDVPHMNTLLSQITTNSTLCNPLQSTAAILVSSDLANWSSNYALKINENISNNNHFGNNINNINHPNNLYNNNQNDDQTIYFDNGIISNNTPYLNTMRNINIHAEVEVEAKISCASQITSSHISSHHQPSHHIITHAPSTYPSYSTLYTHDNNNYMDCINNNNNNNNSTLNIPYIHEIYPTATGSFPYNDNNKSNLNNSNLNNSNLNNNIPSHMSSSDIIVNHSLNGTLNGMVNNNDHLCKYYTVSGYTPANNINEYNMNTSHVQTQLLQQQQQHQQREHVYIHSRNMNGPGSMGMGNEIITTNNNNTGKNLF